MPCSYPAAARWLRPTSGLVLVRDPAAHTTQASVFTLIASFAVLGQKVEAAVTSRSICLSGIKGLPITSETHRGDCGSGRQNQPAGLGGSNDSAEITLLLFLVYIVMKLFFLVLQNFIGRNRLL